jgi:hypothetical protein
MENNNRTLLSFIFLHIIKKLIFIFNWANIQIQNKYLIKYLKKLI